MQKFTLKLSQKHLFYVFVSVSFNKIYFYLHYLYPFYLKILINRYLIKQPIRIKKTHKSVVMVEIVLTGTVFSIQRDIFLISFSIEQFNGRS